MNMHEKMKARIDALEAQLKDSLKRLDNIERIEDERLKAYVANVTAEKVDKADHEGFLNQAQECACGTCLYDNSGDSLCIECDNGSEWVEKPVKKKRGQWLEEMPMVSRVSDVAKKYNLKVATIVKYMRKGLFKGYKEEYGSNGWFLVDLASFQKYMDNRRRKR